MFRSLKLKSVGPALALTMEPVAPRFNLIAGDNGLGKSFLLELAWWALTGTWAGSPAEPSKQSGASIAYEFDGEAAPHRHEATWDRDRQRWIRSRGRPPNPGIVLYARVDGSFSVWDPARNYALYARDDGAEEEYVHAFHFAPDQVLYGLAHPTRTNTVLCEGMLAHWVKWQQGASPEFDLLRRLLARLGPEGQSLVPGAPVQRPPDDRETPTLQMPYAQAVPVTYAPAGVLRIVKLAYLFAWALSAHQREATRRGIAVSSQVILLIDEPETHLHPRWQRTILPSLRDAVSGWRDDVSVDVQCLTATHSPLVLASMEPHFDPERDALWKLDLVGEDVTIERDAWHKRGDANMWLISDVFDLPAPGSREAQLGIERAEALMKRDSVSREEVDTTHAELARVVSENDAFWLSWRWWRRERGFTA